jgi:hypothetical protein
VGASRRSHGGGAYVGSATFSTTGDDFDLSPVLLIADETTSPAALSACV